MIDHISLAVHDLALSRAFYEKALAPLGYQFYKEYHGVVAGFAVGTKPDFWLAKGPTVVPLHLAFQAANRAAVDAFYAAALAAGAKDNGPPGLRPQYHANYYGAFVHDPDGHNIEAVCHDPG